MRVSRTQVSILVIAFLDACFSSMAMCKGAIIIETAHGIAGCGVSEDNEEPDLSPFALRCAMR